MGQGRAQANASGVILSVAQAWQKRVHDSRDFRYEFAELMSEQIIEALENKGFLILPPSPSLPESLNFVSSENFAMTLEARDFAFNAHGPQRYGDRPYSYHLNKVVEALGECGVLDHEDVRAGWLHDVVEDTGVNLAEVRQRFGETTANIVWACSGFGASRKERNADIHAKIIAFPRAIAVKTADRIANVENGVAEKPAMLSMYLREAAEFEALAVQCACPAALLDRLRAAHRQAREVKADLNA